jgi:superfamily I DNA/RNA helicase
VLFTTYTKTLVNVSRQLLDRLLDADGTSVDVRTLDSMAFDVAKRAGCPLGTRPKESDWAEAVDWARQQIAAQSPPLSRPYVQRQLQIFSDQFLQDEFEQVIEGRGLASEDEYALAERAGRRTGLRQSQRGVIFQLYSLVKARLHEKGIRTYGDIRLCALQALKAQPDLVPQYSAVVVDEAQDLSPVALQLAAALVTSPTGLYMTADLSQSIYNRGFSLSKVLDGLDITRRTRVLRQNYRTTSEIMRGAAQLLGASGEGAIETALCRKNGPKPVLHRMPTAHMDAHADAIAAFIRSECRNVGIPLTGAAVLCRHRDDARSLARLLDQRGLKATYVSADEVNLDLGGVKIMTIHSAKGLEFPIVAVPNVDAQNFAPPSRETDEEALAEHWDRERRTVYVAASRAMRRLLLTTIDTSLDQSPILNGLDERSWTWVVG